MARLEELRPGDRVRVYEGHRVVDVPAYPDGYTTVARVTLTIIYTANGKAWRVSDGRNRPLGYPGRHIVPALEAPTDDD